MDKKAGIDTERIALAQVREKTPARNQAHGAGEVYGPTSEVVKYIHLYDKLNNEQKIICFYLLWIVSAY